MKVILDTNVISETAKEHPDQNVIKFLDGLDPTTTYLTSITAAELLYGVELLPEGKKKRRIEDKVGVVLRELFKDRILTFDFAAAARYASKAGEARSRGQSVSFADGAIAAIAIDNSAMIATRDTAPFLAMNADVIDPWDHKPAD